MSAQGGAFVVRRAVHHRQIQPVSGLIHLKIDGAKIE